MERLLAAAFPNARIEITDDSAKHAGHSGARPEGETHFSLRIISDQFAGKTRVVRHRMVYDVLTPLFANGLHALAITADTENE
jgi:BolA protein